MTHFPGKQTKGYALTYDTLCGIYVYKEQIDRMADLETGVECKNCMRVANAMERKYDREARQDPSDIYHPPFKLTVNRDSTKDIAMALMGRIKKVAAIPVVKIRLADCLWKVMDSDHKASITKLAADIKKHGQINPISVHIKDNVFHVVAGHRRCAAMRLNGVEYIEARIYDESEVPEATTETLTCC